MTTAESIRALLFVGSVATVYGTAGIIVLRWAVRRWLKRGQPSTGRSLLLQRAILCLAGVGLLCIAYGFRVEPYWVEVTRTRITSPRLPKGSRPIRIVHLSDLHCDPAPRVEEQLPDQIAAKSRTSSSSPATPSIPSRVSPF